jgi:crotonobetainyl-CoA:carnitine CoA-transferase CaiB-like acyl-CoA transferase
MKSTAYPVVFNGETRKVKSPPPRLGEHTRDVLRALGYDDARIDALQVSGAVGAA